MKKILLITSVIVFYVIISKYVMVKDIIPKDAIRVRILANSNKPYDQNIKADVKNNLEPLLVSLTKDMVSPDDAKNAIISNIDIIKNNIELSLKNRQSYKINFGKNYFPEKIYKGIRYKEGYYDSLLVTLGDGLGDNWWCILFPPLCLLEGEEYTDVEYASYVETIIDKYF